MSNTNLAISISSVSDRLTKRHRLIEEVEADGIISMPFLTELTEIGDDDIRELLESSTRKSAIEALKLKQNQDTNNLQKLMRKVGEQNETQNTQKPNRQAKEN